MKRFSNRTEKYYDYGFRVWRGKSRYYEEWHRHSEMEINLVERGFRTYQIGGQTLRLEPGMLAVFWGMTPHVVLEHEENTILNWISIPLAQFLQWDIPSSLVTTLLKGEALAARLPLYSDAKGFFAQWRADIRSRNPERESMVHREILSCLHRFAEATRHHRSRSYGKSPGYDKVGGMTRLIAERFRDPLTIEEIAQSVKLHPHYAMNLFRKVCQSSLIDFLTRMRITHAQRLLITTDLKVVDIALDSGFGSSSRFYAAFQEYCGQSPKAFRASHSLAAPIPAPGKKS